MLSNIPLYNTQIKSFSRILILAILMIPGLLYADEHRHYSSHHSGKYEYARVVRVEPIYRMVRVTPDDAHNYSHRNHSNWRNGVDRPVAANITPPIVLGGVIGGLIGNGLGNDYNRGLTTITGAIIGSAIASESLAPAHTNHYNYRNKQLVGYQVYYLYRGKYHTTQLNHNPGNRIPMNKIRH